MRSPGKPRVLVTRPLFPQVLERLAHHLDVEVCSVRHGRGAHALAQRLADKHGVLTTVEDRVDHALLQAAPSLRICANMAVGTSNFDLPALRAREVVATNTPGVLDEATADFGLALLLAAARRVGEAERFLRAGHWQEWRHDMLLGHDVSGTTLGVVGLGRIGQGIARRAHHGFGMQVLYAGRSPAPASVEAASKARHVSLERLLKESDHVVLTLPYTAETHHLIGAPELRRMKATATLVNLARGGVVDDAALAEALRRGWIGAAGIDVFEGEPAVHPALLDAPRAVLTPHIGSATQTARLAMARLAADNLIAYLVEGRALTPVT